MATTPMYGVSLPTLKTFKIRQSALKTSLQLLPSTGSTPSERAPTLPQEVQARLIQLPCQFLKYKPISVILLAGRSLHPEDGESFGSLISTIDELRPPSEMPFKLP